MRFTLKPGTWYACELIGDEFHDDRCSYSPIKVRRVVPSRTGDRVFQLDFYHANYPEGVREKSYTLQTVERGSGYLLARSMGDKPVRYLQIYPIDAAWIRRHFYEVDLDRDDVHSWLNHNA